MRVLEQASSALIIASWASLAAALWLLGAAAASAGKGILGAGLGRQTLLGIPVPIFAMASAALLQLLHARVEAALKLFHVPDRLPRPPLNPPGV